MMLGEINYQDLYYPKKQFLNETRIEDDVLDQQFPGMAQFMIILFLVVFSLVIMNLLVGLAVSDINTLLKTGKRDQLINQVELISYVESISTSRLFKILPLKLQDLFKNRVLCRGKAFKRVISVRYSDITDKTFPESLKKILHQHHLRIKEEKEIKDQKRELENMKENLNEIKEKLEQVFSILVTTHSKEVSANEFDA